jgi:hypothetical protein
VHLFQVNALICSNKYISIVRQGEKLQNLFNRVVLPLRVSVTLPKKHQGTQGTNDKLNMCVSSAEPRLVNVLGWMTDQGLIWLLEPVHLAHHEKLGNVFFLRATHWDSLIFPRRKETDGTFAGGRIEHGSVVGQNS